MPARKSVTLALVLLVAAVLTPGAQASAQDADRSYGGPARRAASRPIAVGSVLESALTASDPTFYDSSHFQVWRFTAHAGEDIVIALESEDFDAFVLLVAADGDSQRPLRTSASDTANTARMAVRVPSDGNYLIVANTVEPRDTGRYRLSLKTLAEACGAGGPCSVPGVTDNGLTSISEINVSAARPIALGDSQSGELTRSAGRLRDSSYFHAYRYEGRRGERVVIDHFTPSFDGYLILARQTPAGPVSVSQNDDATDTTHSQLALELPEDGTYVIVATSLRPSTTGRYRLAVRLMAVACAAGGPCEPTASPSSRSRPLYTSVSLERVRSIESGATVSGRLTRSDPTLGDATYFHSYRFTGNASDELAIFLSARQPDVGSFDLFLHLLRVDGDSLTLLQSNDDGGGGKNSMVTARLPYTGEYVVVANGFSPSDTGNYVLNLMRLADACAARRLCEVGGELPSVPEGNVILAASAARLTLNGSVTGQLDSDDDRLPNDKPFQAWRYTGRAAERVVITNRARTFDAYLQLYVVSGDSLREIAQNDDGGGDLDAQLAVELPEAGEYVVVAGSFSTSATGEYRLTIEDMAVACAANGPCSPGETSVVRARLRPALESQHLPLTAGTPVSGLLDPSAPRLPGQGRFQTFRFRGTASDRILLTLESGRFDPYLDLLLPDGTSMRIVGSDDDGGEGTNARLVAVLPGNGDYVVVASALGAGDDTSGFGPYTLALGACDDACAVAGETTRTPRSEASYQLALRTPRRQVPRGGFVAGVLAATDSTLSDGIPFHAYWMQGVADQTLRAALQAAQFDPYLVLFRFDADSLHRIASDDDGGEGTNALLEWPVDRAGTYVIVATAFSPSSSGEYTLIVEQGPETDHARFVANAAAAAVRARLGRAIAAPRRSLSPGQTITAELTDATPRLEGYGRFHSYRFSGRAADRMVIAMDAEFDTYVHLAFVGGGSVQLVGTDDDGGARTNSRLVATLPASGEYLIVASAFSIGDSTGTLPYTVRVARCDDACAAEVPNDTPAWVGATPPLVLRAPRRTLALGSVVSGQLAATDSTLGDGSFFHAYWLETTADASLRASMESSEFDTVLMLYGVNGDSLVLIASDDDGGEGINSLLEWKVAANSSYVVVAKGLSRASLGPYTLSVSPSPAPKRLH